MLSILKLLWQPAAISNLFDALMLLISHFEAEKLKDPSSKNAAIDAVIAVLESEKDKPA